MPPCHFYPRWEIPTRPKVRVKMRVGLEAGPHGHRKTLTFVAGLRCNGIIVPCVFDGPIDAESFLTWVVQFLGPDLRPGDIVVMDSLSIHQSKLVRQAIRAAGTKLLFLPSYSPDLNPIEPAFSKRKTLPRKANARTIEQIEKGIAKLIQKIDRARKQSRSDLAIRRKVAAHATLFPIATTISW